jgi:hypothetical protein
LSGLIARRTAGLDDAMRRSTAEERISLRTGSSTGTTTGAGLFKALLGFEIYGEFMYGVARLG